MESIIYNIRQKIKKGDVLTTFITINVIMFLLFKAINLFFILFKLNYFDLLKWVGVTSSVKDLLIHIWTIITYMFIHTDVLQLLFNMFWLFWFGKIFLKYFSGRSFGSLYILGGISGVILYAIAFNLIPYYLDMPNGYLIGSSASIMAIIMGASFYRPDIKISLFLIGSVKIIYIAIFLFGIDFLFLQSNLNPDGHISHIGGAIIGYVFAKQYNKGRDITEFMSNIIDYIIMLFGKYNKSHKTRKMKVVYKNDIDKEYLKNKNETEDKINRILDKLKETGYNGLTDDEKKTLFDASKK